MQRREFITLLGGAAVAWPLAARAQPAKLPTIGFLGAQTPELFASRLRAFRQGLSDSGYVEGRNVAIEYRWAQGQDDRMPALVGDLVRRQVAVIVTSSTSSVVAARAATRTITVIDYPDGDWQSGTTASICPTAPSTSGRRLTRLRLSKTSALVPSWPTSPRSRRSSTCPARPRHHAGAAKRTTCSRSDRSE